MFKLCLQMLILCWINFYAEELAWKQAELSAGHFPFYALPGLYKSSNEY